MSDIFKNALDQQKANTDELMALAGKLRDREHWAMYAATPVYDGSLWIHPPEEIVHRQTRYANAMLEAEKKRWEDAS